MPLSVVVEVLLSALLEPLLQAAGEATVEAVKDGGGKAIDAIDRAKQQARARALAMSDIVGLAAYHDHRVTRAERAELARCLPKLLARAGVELEEEELLRRWARARAAIGSDGELREEIARIAEVLTAASRRRCFETVVRIVTAKEPMKEPAKEPTSGPYRGRHRAAPAETIRLFGEALSLEARVVEDAQRRA